jgi:hypothetical protein
VCSSDLEELMRGMPDGTAAAPSIAFESDPNTGIYSPGADQLAISTNGTRRLDVLSTGQVRIGDGGAIGALSVQAATNANLHIRDINTLTAGTGVGLDVLNDASNTVNSLAMRGATTIFLNASGEVMRLTSAGLLGLGTSSPSKTLDIAAALGTVGITSNTTSAGNEPTLTFTHAGNNSYVIKGGSNLQFASDNGANTRMTLTTAGLVGIGTTTVDALLEVYSPTNGANLAKFSDAFNNRCLIVKGASGGVNLIAAEETNEASTGFGIAFSRGATEMGRFDGSGRLLVGTSTGRDVAGVQASEQIETTTYLGLSVVNNTSDAGGANIALGKTRGTAIGGTTIVQNGDNLGTVNFCGADGTDLNSPGATIACDVDGTPGANDMPGRLVFATTSDGAASPTERLRITSAGVLQVADAGNITVGTTTGTKIGTATTQKLGFYDKTPVVQPIAVADATDAASAITQLNALLARMRDLGLIAT